MTDDVLLALAGRAEACPAEGDREIDYDLQLLLYPESNEARYIKQRRGAPLADGFRIEESEGTYHWTISIVGPSSFHVGVIPKRTTSLDAVTALIRDRLPNWSIESHSCAWEPRAEAELLQWEVDEGIRLPGVWVKARAATEPLARLAAALRALGGGHA